MDISLLTKKKKDSLKTVLRLYKKANAGHIGASLSCLDILLYLQCSRMSENDRFVLSKGHAALGLYVSLVQAGKIDEKELESFYTNGTYFAAHPPCGGKVSGIHFGTGSLGHGLSLATGMAFSNNFTDSNKKIYCVVSEGDCNEGSTWEAAMFAAQHSLNNLYVIVDNNKLQGFGSMKEVMNLEPFIQKWESFNFDVAVADDGNDFNSLHNAFIELDNRNSSKPKCIIASTVKGKGVSFMENKLEWHYLPMTDDLYAQALKELD